MAYAKGNAVTAGVRAQELPRYRHLRWGGLFPLRCGKRSREASHSLGLAAGSEFNIPANEL